MIAVEISPNASHEKETHFILLTLHIFNKFYIHLYYFCDGVYTYLLQVPSKLHTSPAVIQDIAAFLCLICEIFLAPKLRMQELKPSLKMRIEKIKMLCSPDMSVIPRYSYCSLWFDWLPIPNLFQPGAIVIKQEQVVFPGQGQELEEKFFIQCDPLVLTLLYSSFSQGIFVSAL